MEIICIDANILIEYFRKKDKTKTQLYALAQNHDILLPTVALYEFLKGQKSDSLDYFLQRLTTQAKAIPFDFACAQKAAEIWKNTKSTGKSIEPEDLFIAATSLTWNYRLATLNHKHFEHIPGIQLL
jgi:tRNA(fMet)-specific endonuclease VapC